MPAGQSQSVRGKNGGPRTSDIHGLIAAVHGDLREAIAWFEKGHTVPSSGDKE